MYKRQIQNSTEQLDLKITLEPFTDFIIDLTANRRFTDNQSLYFKNFSKPGEDVNITHGLAREFGSYEISYFALNTLFDNTESLFDRFLANRVIISNILGDGQHLFDTDDDPNNNIDFTNGFGRTQQNVLLPAFISAYTDSDPAQEVAAAANIDPVDPDGFNFVTDVLFELTPKINWQLNYRGLSKVGFFEKYFSSFNVTHGYQSTLQVNSFITNQQFLETNQINESTGNFITKFEVPELVLNEAFVPLLGLCSTA